MLNLDCFGGNLKEIRESLKMSQKDLSEKIGVTPTTISAYEKKTKFPSLDNAIAIANSLCCSLDVLCGGNINTSLNTYSDAIKPLIKIVDTTGGIIVRRVTEFENYISITYPNDHIMEIFLEDWNKVRTLYIEDTIDIELYEAWKEKKYREYQIPIDSNKFTSKNTDGESNGND